MDKILIGLAAVALLACRENTTQQEKKEEVKASMEKIKQDVKETAGAAADYLAEQKKKVEEDLEERRKEIDQKIETLKADSTGRGYRRVKN